MQKMACLAGLVSLAMMGVAHADESVETPTSITGKVDIHTHIADEPGSPYIQTIEYSVTGSTAKLDVRLFVGGCAGEGCLKGVKYVISCTGAEPGQTIESPWFRNYATRNFVTKTYQFSDPKLAECKSVEGITFRLKLGWDDTQREP